MTGKCPYCQKVITSFEVEDVHAAVQYRPQWKGFAYLCPACRTVLSVQINPLTIQTDTVRQIGWSIRQAFDGLLAQILDALHRRP